MKYSNTSLNNVETVMQLAGAKWKMLVINELLKNEMRFSELKRKLGCTAKVLAACLKEMEADNLIVREKQEGKENKVEYYLTDIGYTMRPILDAMNSWGRDYKKLKKLQEKYYVKKGE